mmetsp:Transcript_12817/g.38165  ORF Transcript_12817/g.38165 Transcript_12817/m.38165 type:complete len:305 (+) Transcript_12817:88-1002(+)
MASPITYSVEYAKSGRSTCKGTKEKIPQGALRIAKITVQERDGEPISMSAWYNVVPFFQMMKRMRKKDEIAKDTTDLAGFSELKEEDQATLAQMLSDFHDDAVDFPPKPEKKPAAKKKAPEEGGAAAPSPKKAKKEALEIPDETRAGVAMADLREIASELAERARGLGMNVPDADAARQQIGPLCRDLLTPEGVLDVAGALRAALQKWGMKVVIECACADNAALAAAFKELSHFEYKQGDRFKGTAYKKVSDAIAEQAEPITSGKKASSGKTKIAGIGKASGEKIDEFLTTGAIAKLEEYKNSV